MKDAGTVAVQVHYLGVSKLFWLKFLIIRIAQIALLESRSCSPEEGQ